MNARRIFIVFLLVAAMALSICTMQKAILREGEPYTPGQYAAAIDAAESRFFTVGFRLCEAPEECKTSPESHPVHYDLVLANKTGQALRHVRFTVGLNQKMCDALVSPIWYNEPVDIAAESRAHYMWDPQINLLRASGPMADDLRAMLIEILWDGGSELLRLEANATSMPAEFHHLLEDLPPIDETKPGFTPEQYATDQ